MVIFRTSAEGVGHGVRRTGCGPFERRRPGFTLPRRSKGQVPGFRPYGRSEVSVSSRPFQRSGLRRTLPPTMPSADFCVAVRSPCDDLSLESETQRRSPEVRPTAFTARPPDLPPRSLMAMDFAIACSLVRPGRPRYPVLVHRAAALLHASFRPHLAMTPPAFAGAGSCASLILRRHQAG